VSRAIEIRSRLYALKEMGIADSVLRIYQADIDDLELLALAEEELTPLHDEDTPDGTGSEMAAECG
jgi:hypothetical protein